MEEIELNGKKYVLKETKKEKEFTIEEGYSSKDRLLVHKALNKFLEYSDTIKNLDISKDICAMDGGNVMMVVAKTPRAKVILHQYHAGTNCKIPELEYKAKAKEVIKSKYSTEYITLGINLLKITEESILYFIKGDYPLTMETDDWKIILAPRIENE